jgi:multicomponent Na+:H+ antiporter subunit D
VGSSKLFLLPALILIYVLAGTLDFQAGGIISGDLLTQEPFLLKVVFFLFLFGFAKAAIMPFHNWLPSAMVAPTPVSALLHAVAVVKVGVFSIARTIYFVFGPETMQSLDLGSITAYIAAFTIIVSSIIALSKDNLKARLAYSTISQLSYIVLGMAMLTTSGMTGGMAHITIHAFSKITLFFCAGAIYVAAHKTKISELNGIAKQMPWTMAAFTIGAMNMIGVPLFAGFISKWYLALGSIEAHNMFLLLVLFVSTLLNACYFLPIVYAAYFKELPAGEVAEVKEAPIYMVAPLIMTATGTVLLFLNPSYLLELVRIALSTGG